MDVFSLGTLTYLLFTGRPPAELPHRTPGEASFQHQQWAEYTGRYGRCGGFAGRSRDDECQLEDE